MMKSQALLTDKPFEHAAIIGTLHGDLFGGCTSIVKEYEYHFKPNEEDRHALMLSMITLAVTAMSPCQGYDVTKILMCDSGVCCTM
jgi:hypothetical protein